LARSVAANQVPIGPSCGLDGLVGQVFRPQQRTGRIASASPLNPPAGVGCAKRMNDRGEKFRVGVVRAIERSIPMQFHQLCGGRSLFIAARIRSGWTEFRMPAVLT
jgi:hypothetical protein